MKTAKTRIVYAEPLHIFRQNIVAVIQQDPRFKVVAHTATGEQALAAMEQHHPDILLLYFPLPDRSSQGILEQLKKQEKALPVIVMSAFLTDTLGLYLLRMGVQGLLDKNATPAEIHLALSTVANGQYYAPARLIKVLAKLPQQKEAGQAIIDIAEDDVTLTKLVIDNLTCEEIARLCLKSKSDIEKHRALLIKKTGAKSFCGVVSLLTGLGLIQPSFENE